MRIVVSLVAGALVVAGCATYEPEPARLALTAEQGRALVRRLLPNGLADKSGWATAIHASIASLDLPPTVENICAVIAVTEQESGFKVDPAVPGLANIARKEIESRRESAGVPKIVLDAALALSSPNGRSYRDRLDGVKTERELSDLYEAFIDMVPLGKTFFADRNPVRTGGPMQVAIGFAEAHAEGKGYPYPMTGSIRDEVFTRRGGMYFGIAHLLDYPAPYDRPLYRFADFNAGHYASRNAAFQHAVTQVSGIPLALDGDLLRYEAGRPAREAGATELATRALAKRLDMTHEEIRRDLLQGKDPGFDRTRLATRVFALVEQVEGKAVPRAVVPRILLKSPKFTRKLTSEWFANRVEARYRTCLAR